MKLVSPSIKYKESYSSALEEAKSEVGETTLAAPAENQTFQDFVDELNNHSIGIGVPDGYVPMTTFWIEDDGEVVGRIRIRQELNEYLKKYGGHIGVYIRPSERRKGYATKALAELLKHARKIGLERVLVTCNEDNIGSNKIVQSLGGVLEDTVEVPKSVFKRNRYWISVK